MSTVSKSFNHVTTPLLKQVIEAALLASGETLTIEQLQALYSDEQRPHRTDVNAALAALRTDYANRSIELIAVAGGYRIQIRQEFAPFIAQLWEEKPVRYSRALLETLALIAYRQPITRSDIEAVRGVTVTTQMIKTLMERDWIHVVGQRETPGRPSLYATTKTFLEYFGLSSLDALPPLPQLSEPLANNPPVFIDETDPNL
ncbi:SMC-Scp complex subunit ScpB [Thiospirillum jenense]|uniref:SMC-Scp complex subunit ScpB n=1 Tax=Thiospirillum jenense TaxID=1653858 RepID=A0A839H8A3_9GAMM|nr:SMC-Scp complex subunit ScpB [Thiospirillum jenense]MBB1125673.1 SMC-Scp complex subunit ScpB [Thiospirillum jenense]